jgi:hypothetical protein
MKKAGRKPMLPALKMMVVDFRFFCRVSFVFSHPCRKKPRHGWGTQALIP